MSATYKNYPIITWLLTIQIIKQDGVVSSLLGITFFDQITFALFKLNVEEPFKVKVGVLDNGGKALRIHKWGIACSVRWDKRTKWVDYRDLRKKQVRG